MARSSPDLTATAISRVERGERYPNLQTLEVLARVLRIAITIDPAGTSIKKL